MGSLFDPTGLVTGLSYDPGRFPFQDRVKEILNVHDLTALHLREDHLNGFVDHHKVLQNTPSHREFYAGFEKWLMPLYLSFVEWLGDCYKIPSVIYQTVPTFRLHFPGSVAVGEFHKDADYGHTRGEINFWLPLTDAWDTNTIWIDEGDGQKARNCKYGEVLVFDGVNFVHGNRKNNTPLTRASLDFRLADGTTFRPSKKVSMSAGRKFEVGDYFSVLCKRSV